MRLRTIITRPSRYEEEQESTTSQSMLSRMTKTHKSTVPAYPDLLLRSANGGKEKLPPAAFPSLPFDRRPDGNSQKTHKPTFLDPTQEPQWVESSQHRIIVRQKDETRVEQWLDTVDKEDADMESEYELQQEPGYTMAVLATTNPPDVRVDAKVYWNNIDPGLQLYIFDSLLPQFLLPEFVGEVLGLSPTDLARLVALKQRRLLQPHSTQELWNHCRSLGGDVQTSVDPTVLRQYLDYFAFALQFEEISVSQRYTAVMFLRQRGIEGAFVEALLPERPGLWIRPEYRRPDRLHKAMPAAISPFDEEVEWTTSLSQTLVHKSHNPGMIVASFKSRYFPVSMRKYLLAKSLQDLTAFETWLMYGEILPSTEAPIEDRTTNSAELQPSENSIFLNLRAVFEGRKGEDQAMNIEDHEAQQIQRVLYSATRNAHRAKILRQKLERLPLNLHQKKNLYRITRRRINAEVDANPALETPDSYAGTAVGPSSTNNGRSTGPAERVRPVSPQEHTVLLDDSANLSSHDNKHHPYVLRPESRAALRKSISVVSTSSQEQGVEPQEVTPASPRRRSGNTRDRASSQESYHTAPDRDEDTSMVVESQQYARSPSPPPWSPITDEGTEIPKLDNLPGRSLSRAAEQRGSEHTQPVVLQRSTPWKGDKATLPNVSMVFETHNNAVPVESRAIVLGAPSPKSFRSTMSHGDGMSTSATTPLTLHSSQKAGSDDTPSRVDLEPSIEQQRERHSSDSDSTVLTRSELLPGLREAAVSIASPPSTPSNVDPLSLDASLHSNDIQRPILSAPEKDVTDRSDPLKPRKKKQKTTTQIKGQNQGKSMKQTPKPVLTLQMPPPSTPTPNLGPASAVSSTSPVKRKYKVRSDKGKKRGPYVKRKGTTSPEKASEAGLQEQVESKRTKKI